MGSSDSAWIHFFSFVTIPLSPLLSSLHALSFLSFLSPLSHLSSLLSPLSSPQQRLRQTPRTKLEILKCTCWLNEGTRILISPIALCISSPLLSLTLWT